MAADSASFLIELKERVSGPASTAQSALAKLDTQMRAESKTLRLLEQQMAHLQRGQSVDIAQYKKLSGLIDGQTNKLAGLGAQYLNLQGQGGQAAEQTGFLAEKIKALGGASGIVIAVLVALATAIAIATVKLFQFALGAADASRATLLAFEGLLGTAEAARDLDDAISNLRHHTAVASERLTEIGKTLAFAGLRGGELQKVLGALAKVESTVGQAGVDKYLKRIKAGEDYKKILDEINKKNLADVGERQAAGFDIQIRDLHADLAALFEGINIEPFLAGLREVLMLFSQQTATGRALKAMLTGLFNGIFAVVSAVFPYVKAFIQGMVIGFLRVYIAVKPVVSAIAEAFGGDPNTSLLDFISMLAQAFVYVATAVIFLIGVFAAITGIFVAITTGVAGVLGVIVGFASGFIQAGYNFVAGLAQGIASGASAVVSAAIGVASGAIDAVKGALGISSPSKVMAEMGMHTAAGFAGGVDAGNDNAQSSMASMVDPPQASYGGSTSNSSSKSVIVNVAAGAVNVQGGGGGGASADITAAFTVLAERVLVGIGG